MTYIKVCIFLFVFVVLFGCKEPDNPLKLFLKHPEKLEIVMMRCELGGDVSMQTEQCKYAFFIKANHKDPEAFGEVLLNAQMHLASVKTRLAATSPNSSQHKQLQLEYQKLAEKVKLMLAVLGMNTPE